MPTTYHNSNVSVLAGDHIELKTRRFFLRGWMPGRVDYVSGHSPKDDELEHNDFAWVSIHHGNGARIGVVVVPETRQLDHLVRFVKRADDKPVETAQDYSFGD